MGKSDYYRQKRPVQSVKSWKEPPCNLGQYGACIWWINVWAPCKGHGQAVMTMLPVFLLHHAATGELHWKISHTSRLEAQVV